MANNMKRGSNTQVTFKETMCRSLFTNLALQAAEISVIIYLGKLYKMFSKGLV